MVTSVTAGLTSPEKKEQFLHRELRKGIGSLKKLWTLGQIEVVAEKNVMQVDGQHALMLGIVRGRNTKRWADNIFTCT